VLIYHDIAPQDEARFAAHLRWLAKSWRFVDPQHFAEMISGDEAVREDSLLLTFDDGFASDRRVAENVLNPMGIRALFFVVSHFAALSGKDDWRGYVARNIWPGIEPGDVPDHRRNMTFDDLVYLLETGHSIGGHTASHARLSQVAPENMSAEIAGGADMLEQRLGVKIDHFAYTFGDLDSINATALSVARSRFSFIYTGMRGDNARDIPPWAIRRDAITPIDSFSLVGALLEGGADRRYARNLAEYESWGEGT
jgi:peptidoglycan/xylan/chitin deacetylase (PgdA/CDA1 family)